MNIQRNYSPLMIQFKKGRSASAWWPPRRPLQNPLILDQIFDDQRDRAPLQARDSRKVRTRKRLTRSHQIEYQVPINLSRCFVRRTLPASESEPGVGHRLAFVSIKSVSQTISNVCTEQTRTSGHRSNQTRAARCLTSLATSLYTTASPAFCRYFELLSRKTIIYAQNHRFEHKSSHHSHQVKLHVLHHRLTRPQLSTASTFRNADCVTSTEAAHISISSSFVQEVCVKSPC